MTDAQSLTTTEDAPPQGGSFIRTVLVATGAVVALIAVLFIAALVLAVLNPVGVASFMGYVRDVFISLLCLQSIVIVVAVAILIVQIARFVNLLRNETKPVTDQARETLTTVQTSTRFVSKAAAEPLVALRSFFSGFKTFLKVLISLNALRVLFRGKERRDEPK